MGEYSIQISTKLIDQLACDDEKVKRKVTRPRPKKVVEHNQKSPRTMAGSFQASPRAVPLLLLGGHCHPPMYLPVTHDPPLPPSPAIQEVETIRAVVEESAKVLERLDKAESERKQELARRAKELHDREFKLPYQNPVPCAEEKAGCLECYLSNGAQDPLKCAEAVKRFEACVCMARHSGSIATE